MISNGAQFALNHHQGLFTNYIYRVGQKQCPPNSRPAFGRPRPKVTIDIERVCCNTIFTLFQPKWKVHVYYNNFLHLSNQNGRK